MRILAISSMLLLGGCGAISNISSQISNWGNEEMPTYDGSRPGQTSKQTADPMIPPPQPTMQDIQNLREFDNLPKTGGYNPQMQDPIPQPYYPQQYQQPQTPQPYGQPYGQQVPPQQPQYYYPQQQPQQTPQLQQIYPPVQQQAPVPQYQYPQQGYTPAPQGYAQPAPVDDFPPEYGQPARRNQFDSGNQAPNPFPPTR